MMPPEFISTEPCDVHLIDTSPVPTSATTNVDGRRAFARYIADCEKCAIVPDVAGAFHWAWTHAAPEQKDVDLSCAITDAAGKAFNDMFHKCRAEVSMDWWQRIWARAVEWAWEHPPAPVLRAPNSRTVQEDELLDAVMLDAGTSVGYRLERLFKVLSVAEGRTSRAVPVQEQTGATDVRDAVIGECIAALREIDDGDAPEFSACIEKLQGLRV